MEFHALQRCPAAQIVGCHTTECKGQREPPCQEQAAAIAGRLSMPAKRNSFIAETLFPDLDANAGFVSHSFS